MLQPMYEQTSPHVYTHMLHREAHSQTHKSGLPVEPCLVNYFPLEMNQPAAVWLVWLPTKPNCHRAWRWVRESWARGQTLLLRSNCECLIMTEWPQWLQMSNCPTATPPRNSLPNISQKPTNPVFFSFLYQHGKRQQPSSKSRRLMLMSVSSILMTLQINWALNEVPLSAWSSFLFFLFFVSPSAAEALAKA